ncbi:MAG: ABC transporter permease [Thermoleophilia bacterium]|nr:ABC transporter permease [Thermoleophilia bacterium]MDQ3856986.1 ABC transporter permease [Actinomycetota bacterium]
MTLWILSVLVFVGAQILPGDVARRILGRDASPQAVAALNEQLGTDRPVIVQYWDWVSSFVTGDLGTSYSLRVPVSDLIFDALANSFKLAAVAFVIVVPLGILGGVFAALREGRFADRLITIAGLSATVVPEFVSSIILILVFGLWISLLPITAAWPPGAGPLTQLKHLILPSLPLVLVLFGYIARMARAGTIEALDADYTRTAVLKGLPQRTVIRRHVLRNALLPTIAVIATQTGYLIGGLVVIEVIFNYQGVGRLLFNAARAKDFPMLQSAVLVVGIVYLAATLLADVAYSLLNPRIRHARA